MEGSWVNGRGLGRLKRAKIRQNLVVAHVEILLLMNSPSILNSSW